MEWYVWILIVWGLFGALCFAALVKQVGKNEELLAQNIQMIKALELVTGKLLHVLMKELSE